MDIAVVTNADSGITPIICKRLIEMGFRVYGLANSFKGSLFGHPEFKKIECSLNNPKELQKTVDSILKDEGNIQILIHIPKPKPKRALEKTSLTSTIEQVEELILSPIYLSRATLPSLKAFRGHLIYISWDGLFGPIGNACFSGMNSFLEDTFEELQDSGVSVTQLSLKCNPKDLEKEDSHKKISAPQVADSIERILRFPKDNTISHISIRPQSTLSSPLPPKNTAPLDEFKGVMLPEKEFFPSEPEPIFTPTPERPQDAPPIKKQRPNPSKKPKPVTKKAHKPKPLHKPSKPQKAPQPKSHKPKPTHQPNPRKHPQPQKPHPLPIEPIERSFKPPIKKKSTRRGRINPSS